MERRICTSDALKNDLQQGTTSQDPLFLEACRFNACAQTEGHFVIGSQQAKETNHREVPVFCLPFFAVA